MKNKVLIIYGSLNSVPSPEGAAPAKVIQQTVESIDDNRFKVLSNWNVKLEGTTYDKNTFLHAKQNSIDKLCLLFLKLRFNYKKRKELFITAQDSQLLFFISVCRFLLFNKYNKIIIHVSPGLVNMIKSVFPNRKIVFYHHGTSLHTKLSVTQWDKMVGFTDAIFGVNNIAIEKANSTFKLKYPREKYFGIKNAIVNKDITRKKHVECKTFSFIGRVCKEKGILNLIESFKEVSKNNKELKLIIVGGAGAKDEIAKKTDYFLACEKYVKENNLNVIFTGFLKGKDLLKILLEIHVLILSTDKVLYEEGMPLAILEALSVGIPVITTDTGGCPEVIEHMNNGLLVTEYPYINQLANFMKLISENNDLYKTLSENAYKSYLENHTYQVYTKTFLDALDKINFFKLK